MIINKSSSLGYFWKLGLIFLTFLLILHYLGPSGRQEAPGTATERCICHICEFNNLDCTNCPLLTEDDANLRHPELQTSRVSIEEIRSKWLIPPSTEPYNLTTTIDDEHMESVRELHASILEILGPTREGFFIECGAFDGVWISNTLHLEQDYGWTGLLVEADPKNFQKLALKNRKAWSMNACLAINPFAEKTIMTRSSSGDALTVMRPIARQDQLDALIEEEFEAQCFPLASILAALGQNLNVDYMSLDVEGAELRVLLTIPWDCVHIKVINVESVEERVGPIKALLESKGYSFVKSVFGYYINDYIFVHN